MKNAIFTEGCERRDVVVIRAQIKVCLIIDVFLLHIHKLTNRFSLYHKDGHIGNVTQDGEHPCEEVSVLGLTSEHERIELDVRHRDYAHGLDTADVITSRSLSVLFHNLLFFLNEFINLVSASMSC